MSNSSRTGAPFNTVFAKVIQTEISAVESPIRIISQTYVREVPHSFGFDGIYFDCTVIAKKLARGIDFFKQMTRTIPWNHFEFARIYIPVIPKKVIQENP